MSPTVACPGCGASLPAPAHLVGQIVQCARCARQFALPRPVLDAVAVAPAAPPPRSRRDNDEDDDRPTRRAPKRKPKGVPVWVWAVLAGGLVLLVGGGGLLAYFFLSPGATDGTRLSDGWVKMTPAGTTVSWEFPTKPEVDAKGPGGALPKAGENLYGCVLKQSGKQSVIFLVTITHHEGHDKLFPGQTLDDFAKAAQPGGGTVFGRHLRKYDLQGRTANLFFHEVTEKVILIVTEPGRTYRFEAFGSDVDERNLTVKRFVESVTFDEPRAAGGAAAPVESLPSGWSRGQVRGCTMTVAMPGLHLAPGLQRAHPDPQLRVCLQGLSNGPSGAIEFSAEYFSENPLAIRPEDLPPDKRPIRIFQIEGREVWITKPSTIYNGERTIITLGVRLETGKIVNCTVAGKDITPETPDVKRFFESVRMK